MNVKALMDRYREDEKGSVDVMHACVFVCECACMVGGSEIIA